jgi:hypothetical protein
LRFFKRFLETPWCRTNDILQPLRHPRPQDKQCFLQRSAPLGFSLSTLLGELVLLLVERYVQNAVPNLHTLRVHDDFHFLGTLKQTLDGWRAFVEGLNTLGLQPNMAKSGSIVIGKELHELASVTGLPLGSVRWKYLELTKEGYWLPDMEKMKASLPNLLSDDTEPILKKVARFNDCMRACRRMLGKPCFAMGRPHLCGCRDALENIELELCGGQKATAWLKDLLSRSFPNVTVTDALLHWPPLLGGLGLDDPHAELRHSLRAFESSSNWTMPPGKPTRTSLEETPSVDHPRVTRNLLPRQSIPLNQTCDVPRLNASADRSNGYPMYSAAPFVFHPPVVVSAEMGYQAKLQRWAIAMQRWLTAATKPVRNGREKRSLPAPIERCRKDYDVGQLTELACFLSEIECTYGTATLLPDGLEPIWLLERLRHLKTNAQNVEEDWVDVSLEAEGN